MTGICTPKRGDLKKQYNLKSKGKDKRKLTVHADGEILAEDKYHKTISPLAAQ
jgi:hypothetical protein